MKRLIVFFACIGWAAFTIAAPAAAEKKSADKPAAPAAAAGDAAQDGQKTAPPATTPPAGQKAPAQAAKKDEAKVADSKFKFEKPDIKPYTDFPEVPVRMASLASYIGFQFGTGKLDVAYVCFDTESGQKTPDRAYVFVASSTNAKPVAIHGHAEQVQQSKNVKMASSKPVRFEIPPLRARINDADVIYKIECVCGHEARANCHMTAQVAYKEGKESKEARNNATFVLHANLSNLAVPVPNEIKVLPLLGAAKLQLYKYDKTQPPWVRPYITIGENLLLEPLRGMDNSFAMQLKNKDTERIVEKGKLPIKIPLFSGAGDQGAGDNFQLKSAKAGKYEVQATIDAGPFGDLTTVTDLPVTANITPTTGGNKKTK